MEAGHVHAAAVCLARSGGRSSHLENITSRANQELRAALGAITGGRPVEDLLDRALAAMENLSESAETMTRLLDDLLKG